MSNLFEQIMAPTKFPFISKLKTANQFTEHLSNLGIHFPAPYEEIEGKGDPLNLSYTLKNGFTIGNRFCIHPMEGWDGDSDGRPSQYTERRWKNFGRSGAKLIWGGEATAVQHNGRGNPNQLLLIEKNLDAFEHLRNILFAEHKRFFSNSSDLYVGLQLTHSGRFSRPNSKTLLEPKILFHHPYLEEKFGVINNSQILSDAEIDDLIGSFVKAAVAAQKIGFQFVDIKHCHGYLGHEFLTAYERPGPYGGSFINRTRFIREVVNGIRINAPGLDIGVRLSAFDFIAFSAHPESGIGIPVFANNYPKPFGASTSDFLKPDLSEPIQFLELLEQIGIELVNLTAGSPYYNPHIQRPALYPPSDGYSPPEDPLQGVFRQINIASELKREVPNLCYVGSGYTYLQEWLPMVARTALENELIDFVGVGRMVLSYPEFPSDCISGKELNRKKLCRTFSECTTAPRNGLISGCYPLDHFYKNLS